ncbi:DUF6944 family repetitive protein [Fictibacillus phosphorivorans]|uniref:DUF6944 family repetitive protein n=1 Tax=Fictibacillus phosphorivorans TaxID=1221500 RepID=UPI00203C0C52|nr:hypothetical protein [Fictibacillus phosphorivorans]MCM3719349.1 hypothetical protein [Fictibacillus phosphorivorans]MCM3776970.1 hypothetical protein [Fictibacillus phosphorivorans]
MDNQQKQRIGSIIQAIGTVLSAYANSPNRYLSTTFLDDLDVIGNALQATGNALIADGQEPLTLSRIGNEVQAVGNTTVIAGMITPFEDRTKLILNIKGNLLQSFGAGVVLGDELEDEPSLSKAINVISNILQSVGNALQALGGKYKLDHPYGDQQYAETLNFVGSWIQATGAVLSTL